VVDWKVNLISQTARYRRKEREPVYAVDDVAGMLFLQTSPGTLVGYRL